jgi:hypothetical protein
LISTLVFAALVAGAAAQTTPYQIVPTSTALLTGTFTMHGRITVAVGVTGEHVGQTITRTWVFQAHECGPTSCALVVLTRERSAGTHSTITLRRGLDGTYRGTGAFDAPLRCEGRTRPRGETAPYRISARITQAAVVNDVPFAYTIRAGYVGGERIDHTICPLGESHDAARYTGTLVLPASPAVRR